MIDHSLYLHCLICRSWGIPTPENHYDGAPCGNCDSVETVAYHPSCCLLAAESIINMASDVFYGDRNQFVDKDAAEDLLEAIEKYREGK